MKIYSLFAIFLVVGSCSDFYFSEPQPVNSKNILTVPKRDRGTWSINDRNSNGHTETLIIGANYYKQIEKYFVKESMADMDFDTTIYFIDNKIYSKVNGELEGGYDYIIEGDTIMVNVIDAQIVEFGEKAFLRKIDYGYILNLNHEKMNDWWEIIFVDTRNKDRTLIRELTSEDLHNDESHKILHKDFSQFIVAEWSIEHIQNFIDNGGFSDTTMILNQNGKLED